jgi:DUF1009 family protein
MIDALKDHGVRECVMLGQIAPNNLFNLRPDLKAMALLLRLKEKNAHTIFVAIADEMAKEGVRLVDPLGWLGEWMPGPGFSVGKRLDEREESDVAYGFRIAREIARLEIGQSVVVKEGTTLAVEGFEGVLGWAARGGHGLAPRKVPPKPRISPVGRRLPRQKLLPTRNGSAHYKGHTPKITFRLCVFA